MGTFFEDPALGWDVFVKKSELLQRRLELVPSGALTIICLIEELYTAPDVLTGE